MATIQDVAKRAAVSVSTVSNVLNGRADRMRPGTLSRIEDAIEALQFRPSKLVLIVTRKERVLFLTISCRRVYAASL